MEILSNFKSILLTNNIEMDVTVFFETNGCHNIADHTKRVMSIAKSLAVRFGIEDKAPVTAAYLHDVGLVIPVNQMLESAASFGIQILDAERFAPGLLHQKISRVIAAEVFGNRDEIILDAIGCHTTLKANASDAALVLFVADKLTWNAPDSKVILDRIREGLEKSLQHAAYTYISYLCEHSENLHPWALEAYADLRGKCGIA